MPSGLGASPAEAIIWTPSEAQDPSTNVVFIAVSDTNPMAGNATSLSVTSSFTLFVREVNPDPGPTQPVNQTITDNLTGTNRFYRVRRLP